jgi:hypothetical protein
VIIDRCGALRQGLDSVRRQQVASGELAVAQTRRDALRAHHERLFKARELVDAMKLHKAADWGVKLPESRLNLVAQIQQWAENFHANPTHLTATDDSAFSTVEHRLRSISENVLEEARAAWRDYRNARLPPDNSTVLQIFAQSHAATVKDIQSLRRRLQEKLNPTTPTADTVTEFADTIKQYDELVGQVLGGDLPDAVQDALRQSGSFSGAPLRLFTDEVLDWLREKGIEDSFRVKAQRT